MTKPIRYYGFNIYVPAGYLWPYSAIIDGQSIYGTLDEVKTKINNWWHAQMQECTYHGDWTASEETR